MGGQGLPGDTGEDGDPDDVLMCDDPPPGPHLPPVLDRHSEQLRGRGGGLGPAAGRGGAVPGSPLRPGQLWRVENII